MYTLIVLLFLSMAAVHSAPPPVIVTPALQRRLERVQQLSDLPTARMILRLLARDPLHREPQVVKRLRRAVDAWQQQALSLTDQFLLSKIGEETPLSLVNLVLYLAQDDATLFQHYMTRKERERWRQAVARYERLPHWPENRQALLDCLTLLRAAKSVRDMIAHLERAVAAGATSPEAVVDAELVRVAFRRMKTLCRQRAGATAANATFFSEEVDDYLLTLTALLVDRAEQQQQLAIVMALWQNLCSPPTSS
jgi:hypothetical protein